MSVLTDTFLGDTEICCPPPSAVLLGGRDSLPDSLLSAIASVDPGRPGRTQLASHSRAWRALRGPRREG